MYDPNISSLLALFQVFYSMFVPWYLFTPVISKFALSIVWIRAIFTPILFTWPMKS